ncbi:YxeA family protein [Lapidilactobacillus wuchangensis]|uniref:YxeA family protein n=1 Tax=Lapidilactobacillus wuchangensis TaxID=2486001 RepID=UPI000F7AE3E1|nr:YxeA family protein [Lapidilactobacillus wuchangensis]
MKKILAILAVLMVSLIGYCGFKYYQQTYLGTEAYAIVPAQVPSKEAAKDLAGQPESDRYAYHYKIQVVTKNGQKMTRTFDISGRNPQPLPANSFIKLTASTLRVVVGPQTISENEVPVNVLAKLYD